jgi:lipopolysaccharide transport system ATP-binding protein
VTGVGETLIRVEAVSKKFCRSLKKSLWYGMEDLGNELRGRRHGGEGELRPDEFWAVRDISFELRRGECLGLIGHNGAGKTTLLRMLNGLIKPDRGRIEIRGKVGALIALGAGFNPILTGRENIYTNASVLGLSRREVDARLDEIIAFSEIGDFIDTPVQNYSSGMSVRLGFSIAAVLIKPDVLFLDEVLAVGDIGFVVKCLNTVRRLTPDSAVVFVSHSMQFISSFCTRAMVLQRGETLLDSPNPADAIDRYYSLVRYQTQTSGTGEAEILAFDLLADGTPLDADDARVRQGSALGVRFRVRIGGPRTGAHVLVFIHDETMAPLVCVPIHSPGGGMLLLSPGEHTLEVPLGVVDLNAGKFNFVIGVRDANTSISLARVEGLRPFRVFSDATQWGKIVRPAVPTLTGSSGSRTPRSSR